MKKSSLKSMMSRIIIYSITVLLSSLFCWREADAQVRGKNSVFDRDGWLFCAVIWSICRGYP